MSAEMSRTIAGIVAFYPDPARVLRLIASIADDVSRIVLFANSPLEAAIKNGLSTAAAQTSVTLIAPGENVGLGSAYNRIVELARLEGAEFVLLFDQDSTPSEGMVRRLEHLADELKSRGEKPAVVGPRPTKTNGEPFKVPRRRSSAEGLPGLAVDFAISSGSLIALRATAEVGPFNEEFFIDAIDIEWCSRAWSAGWSVAWGRHPHDPPARKGRDPPSPRIAADGSAVRAALHLLPQPGSNAAPAACPVRVEAQIHCLAAGAVLDLCPAQRIRSAGCFSDHLRLN